jgi:hypothetical protein
MAIPLVYFFGNQGDFKGARHPGNVYVTRRNAVTDKGVLGPLHQFLGDKIVETGHNQPELQPLPH